MNKCKRYREGESRHRQREAFRQRRERPRQQAEEGKGEGESIVALRCVSGGTGLMEAAGFRGRHRQRGGR